MQQRKNALKRAQPEPRLTMCHISLRQQRLRLQTSKTRQPNPRPKNSSHCDVQQLEGIGCQTRTADSGQPSGRVSKDSFRRAGALVRWNVPPPTGSNVPGALFTMASTLSDRMSPFPAPPQRETWKCERHGHEVLNRSEGRVSRRQCST